MDIAIVGGTGKQGFGIGLRLAEAGHRVLIGSRDPARASASAAEASRLVGEPTDVVGMGNADAAATAPVVFVTVPHEAQANAIAGIGAVLRPDAIVVITSNPIARDVIERPGAITSEQQRSAAEEAAEALSANCRVVAGFQSVAAKQLRDLRAPVEGDVLLCGDDAEAKAQVGALIDDIPDLRWVDAGALSMARAVERLTGLLISVNHRYGVSGATIKLEGRDRWGAPPGR